MNRKRIWFLIPTVLLPYLALGSVLLILFCTRSAFLGAIMENVFRNNIWLLAGSLLIYCVLCLVLSILCFIFSLKNNWEALWLAKTVMRIKLILIPAYVMIFVLGFFLAITLFTMPFAFVLFLVDSLTLIMTGMVNIAAIILASQQKQLPIKSFLWFFLLQFVFCADVIASILFYTRLKKAHAPLAVSEPAQ